MPTSAPIPWISMFPGYNCDDPVGYASYSPKVRGFRDISDIH